MAIEIRMLEKGDEAVFANVAPDVFDDPLDAHAIETFLSDPRHHIAVAVEDGLVIGFASAVHYVHPDKPRPELWINEVAVSPQWQGRRVGTALVRAILERGRELGCSLAWVTTETSNSLARRLYASTGGEEAPDTVVMYNFPLTPGSANGDEA